MNRERGINTSPNQGKYKARDMPFTENIQVNLEIDNGS